MTWFLAMRIEIKETVPCAIILSCQENTSVIFMPVAARTCTMEARVYVLVRWLQEGRCCLQRMPVCVWPALPPPVSFPTTSSSFGCE